MATSERGPLNDVRVIELAGIGPGPYAGMMLADMGAEVIKVDRVGGGEDLFPAPRSTEILDRGKRSIEVDLKSDAGREIVMSLVAESDALIEGFRPGVTERLGLGPAEALAANPRLVYGRITGWGQHGPLSDTAGHDIDYIAVAGALGSIGDESPVVPLNLVADFGGGGMFLVAGVLAGVVSARSTGVGTIVDAAMVDGVAHLMSMMHGGRAAGWWRSGRGRNVLDGTAPFYSVYETADGEHMAVGSLEPKFFAELVERLELDAGWCARQYDVSSWPEMRTAIRDAFMAETRADWIERFAGGDACVAPVMSLAEAVEHPHLSARGTFFDVDGVVQPAAAPRFSGHRTRPEKPVDSGVDTVTILSDIGYSMDRINELKSLGIIG
jgi:alpha-methylacyl-CoA racemase